jgi:hypothetical protein
MKFLTTGRIASRRPPGVPAPAAVRPVIDDTPTPPEHPGPPDSRPCTDLARLGTPATEVVIRWIGWHLLELVGVGVPAALAVTVSVWWGLLSVLAGALWAVHEIRIARRGRALSPTGRAATRRPGDATDGATDEEASA